MSFLCIGTAMDKPSCIFYISLFGTLLYIITMYLIFSIYLLDVNSPIFKYMSKYSKDNIYKTMGIFNIILAVAFSLTVIYSIIKLNN